jgi:NADPH:quinone reductase-like Zn-dependent oxidoreductase
LKAIQIHSFGTVGELIPRDVAEPTLAAGYVRIRIEAASVNPSDVKNFAGRMQQTTLPRILGRDFAGTVIEGPALWLGKKVWGTGGARGFTSDGSFAQSMVVSANTLLEILPGWTALQSAAVALPAWTAWESLKNLTSSWPGKTILIVGGAGAVGSSAAFLAERRGAQVWRTTRKLTSDSEKGWIDLSTGPLPEQVLKATGGLGVDFVFNTVGGETFQPSLACLKHQGKMVSIASAGTPQVTFNLIDFYHKELTLVGVDTLALSAEVATQSLQEILPDLQAPEFPHFPVQTFPLEKTADAFTYKGKAVLLPNG